MDLQLPAAVRGAVNASGSTTSSASPTRQAAIASGGATASRAKIAPLETARSAMPRTMYGTAREASPAEFVTGRSAERPGGNFAPSARQRGIQLPPPRLMALDKAPESSRMIHVPGVCEFVNQEVTHY